ncbi:MAG: hypothetical protein IPO09_08075 [Anaeromyxobacter sp.]|nr:hypothetical protein [Anaeromyxobacter sp.]
MTKTTLTALTLAAAALLAGPADAQDRGWDDAGELEEAWPDQGRSADDDGFDVSMEDEGGVSLSTFQEPLSPYGAWQDVPGHGEVWRPSVPAGWRPYYYGRWEWTTEGWLWVSDEPFGWATYHYGRWSFDRGLGWFWVPGYQWAPAWVSWRYSGDVVGWAPLAPGLSLYVTDFAFVDFHWTFVPTVRFCGTPVYGIAYAPGHAGRWYHATRPAPPRPGYRPEPGRPRPPQPSWGGPAPRFVEDRSGRPVRPARIVAAPGPAGGRVRPGEIGVYRPEARQDRGRGRDVLPGAAARPRGFDDGRDRGGRWEGGAVRPRGGDERRAPDRRDGSPNGLLPRRGQDARPAPAPQGGERFDRGGSARPWERPAQAAPERGGSAPPERPAPRLSPPPQREPTSTPAPAPQRFDDRGGRSGGDRSGGDRGGGGRGGGDRGGGRGR